MDRLDAMRLLVAAVDAGSLSGAARAAGLPLATVSRRVADLEAALGAQLLNRSSRGLSLTDPGADYLAACRRILEDVAEAERAASGEFSAPRGLLTVTAPIVFGRLHVLPAVAAFLKTYAEVAVRLEQTDRVVSLVEERVDAAIRIGALPDSGLRARRVGAVRWVVCGAPAYLAARGRPDRPADLPDHDCVTFASLMPADRWRFGPSWAPGRADETVRIHSRLMTNTAEAAIAAAADGLGLTRVLSYQAADAVASGALQVVLAEHEPGEWPVHLVYPAGMVPQKVRAFIDFAAPRIEASLAVAAPR
ncbi:transcriptional regulator GstR [Stappia sp. 22II-S9-Z10]|nr:transcriptional regulator GstR [Stappia sp. 22II-S9-Z10]